MSDKSLLERRLGQSRVPPVSQRSFSPISGSPSSQPEDSCFIAREIQSGPEQDGMLQGGDDLFSGWLCYKRLAEEGSYNLSAILLIVELLAADLPLYLESIIGPGFCCLYALRVLKFVLKFFVAAGTGTDSDNHNKAAEWHRVIAQLAALDSSDTVICSIDYREFQLRPACSNILGIIGCISYS